MIIECGCGKGFSSKLAPCPENRPGCLVAHYDSNSFVCPHCGKDAGPDIRKAFLEGRVVVSEAVSIVNTRALEKIELK